MFSTVVEVCLRGDIKPDDIYRFYTKKLNKKLFRFICLDLKKSYSVLIYVYDNSCLQITIFNIEGNNWDI